MRVVYSPHHAQHDPPLEILLGTPRPYPDSPARAEAIRGALAQDSTFEFVEPTAHGVEPIAAVHDAGLIRFLERAVRPGMQLIPDTILHPAVREGMGPLS